MAIWNTAKVRLPIQGTVVKDIKTKHLVQRIRMGQIAVIRHRDIDEMAAKNLIEAKVRAVVNADQSMTGSYPTLGPQLLAQAGIPIFEISPGDFHYIEEGEMIYLGDDFLISPNHTLEVKEFTPYDFQHYTRIAEKNVEQELNRFIDNTLKYAQLEKDFVLKPLPIPEIQEPIRGRHVLVVVRGCGYKEDLLAIRSYIDEVRPVIIGVDGGADALLEVGLQPDLIIGDMDSVSDAALQSCPELIVHAYLDGRAPGMERVQSLGLNASILAAPGTSEDIAMLVAFEKQAELIVTLGTHTHMIDFLEKGRKGMASTLLVRMKIGTKLIDAKGVSKLYRKKQTWRNVTAIGLAAIVPIVAMSFINPMFRRMLQMVWLNIKIAIM